MSSSEEDEALTWAGGRDPSHYETPEAKPKAPSPTPKASKANSGTDPGGPDDLDTVDEEQQPATGGVVLIVLGLLGGVYLLYTIGWFVSWQREVYVDTDVLELAAFRAQQFLAILAAPLWFATTIFLTRDRKPALRLLWLVIGALVLVPWSFTFGR